MDFAVPLVVGFDLDMTLVDSRPGIAAAETVAGAREALAAVRRHRGRTVAVTGESKAAAPPEQRATIYVGDHVHDVEGARAAGALSVSVLTGGSTEAELRAAGTDVVLASLHDFPAWLDRHLLDSRLAELERQLTELGSVMVAFSGGADSAFLLAAAVRALGPEQVVAATAYSDSLPRAERSPAREFAEALGVRVLTPTTREMDREGYRANAGDRCYFCKAELLDVLGPLSREHGIAHVATGTNADDAVAGFRPGIRAAAERGAATPLRDAGLTKDQIRVASREWGLPTWDKPAAACLSSRVAYGIEVSPFRLARVERAESSVRAELASAGIDVRDLRVRDLGDHARIEVDAPAVAAVAGHPPVVEAVMAAGFGSAEVDPRGFRSGSMNERLADPERYR